MSQFRGWRSIFLVLGLAVIAWMVIDFNGRLAQLNHLKAYQATVEVRYADSKATLSALEAEKAYALSDAAVEKWAYEEGHMVRPGDVPVVPLPAMPVTPTPVIIPTVTTVPMSNSEAWQALILGIKLP
jgi:hypothetical protein